MPASLISAYPCSERRLLSPGALDASHAITISSCRRKDYKYQHPHEYNRRSRRNPTEVCLTTIISRPSCLFIHTITHLPYRKYCILLEALFCISDMVRKTDKYTDHGIRTALKRNRTTNNVRGFVLIQKDITGKRQIAHLVNCPGKHLFSNERLQRHPACSTTSSSAVLPLEALVTVGGVIRSLHDELGFS